MTTISPLNVWLFLGVLVLGLVAGARLVASADVAAGGALARKLCANCHLVGDTGRASDAVPSFQAMANNSAFTDRRLLAWLFDPHPPMPSIHLSTQEIDDIVAYIRSLKK